MTELRACLDGFFRKGLGARQTRQPQQLYLLNTARLLEWLAEDGFIISRGEHNERRDSETR